VVVEGVVDRSGVTAEEVVEVVDKWEEVVGAIGKSEVTAEEVVEVVEK
jgi:hypothetical protein